jgi:hypothetical protein
VLLAEEREDARLELHDGLPRAFRLEDDLPQREFDVAVVPEDRVQIQCQQGATSRCRQL